MGAHHSDPAFRVLHVVRIRGRVPTEGVGQAVGDVATAERLLAAAADQGHVVHREGRAAGWSLTPEGRSVHVELLAAERSAAGADEVVGAAYERFLEVNQLLIEVCTRWQLGADGMPNDHSDAAYDASVVSELAAVDQHVQPVCADLAAALGRFGSYGPRLSEALDRVRQGEAQWFTSPVLDSYHTVWFELHEDLLQTLGIERTG